MEFQSVLHGDVVVAAADDESVLLSEVGLEGQCCLTFVINILNSLAHHLDELGGNALALKMNADAMRLHDGCGPIDIDDESGDVVSLAMHEAIGVVGGIIDNADGASHGECRLQLAIPEGIVDLDIVERQHSDGNGAYLIMADGDELASGGHHSHHLALVNILW